MQTDRPLGEMSDEETWQPRDRRVPIMMTAQEVEIIDEWMFRNRVRTRAEAIRLLITFSLHDAESDRMATELSRRERRSATRETGAQDDH